MRKIEARRIRTFSLFKYMTVGMFLLFIIPFVLIALNSAMSDTSNMYFNGYKLGPVEGIIFAPFLSAMFAISAGVMNWVFLALGLKVWAIFQPIEIEYEEYNKSSKITRTATT